jgi:hypothetical protein
MFIHVLGGYTMSEEKTIEEKRIEAMKAVIEMTEYISKSVKERKKDFSLPMPIKLSLRKRLKKLEDLMQQG